MDEHKKEKSRDLELKTLGLIAAFKKFAHMPKDAEIKVPAFNYNQIANDEDETSSAFNMHAKGMYLAKIAMADVPRRLGIQRYILSYRRKLYALRKHAPMALAL